MEFGIIVRFDPIQIDLDPPIWVSKLAGMLITLDQE